MDKNKLNGIANELKSLLKENKTTKLTSFQYLYSILSFIFYKYLSDKEKKFFGEYSEFNLETQKNIHNDQRKVEFIKKRLGFFIKFDDLFDSWHEKGNNFKFSDIKESLENFNNNISSDQEKIFKNIFTPLQNNLELFGNSINQQNKNIKNIVDIINEIDSSNYNNELNYIYQKLLNENSKIIDSNKPGEYYTPNKLTIIVADVLSSYFKNCELDQINIYDPTCGTGSLLTSIGKKLSKNNIKYFGQEIKEWIFNLSRMTLVMSNINWTKININCGNTLDIDWPRENNEINPYYMDIIAFHPPYSSSWDSSNKSNDPRFTKYELPPSKKSDFAFVLHGLYHLKQDGVMGVILTNAALNRQGSESEIRKKLIHENKIDTIIQLPNNLFSGIHSPIVLVILKQNTNKDNILFIDASNEQINKIPQTRKIVDAITSRSNTKYFSKVVSKDEIIQNNCNLEINKYIDSLNDDKSFDMHAILHGIVPNKEINELEEYWQYLPNLKPQLFKNLNNNYSSIIDQSNYVEIIKNCDDLENIKEKLNLKFNEFKLFLDQIIRTEIIINHNSNSINLIENYLNDLLDKNIPKVTKYKVLTNLLIDIINDDIQSLNDNFYLAKELIINNDSKCCESKLFSFELLSSFFYSDDKNKIDLLKNEINITNEKQINKTTKELTKELNENIKTKIELLTDDEIVELLKIKWIKLFDGLENELVKEITNNIENLINKYQNSFIELNNQTKKISHELCNLINELNCNDKDIDNLNEFKKILEGN